MTVRPDLWKCAIILLKTLDPEVLVRARQLLVFAVIILFGCNDTSSVSPVAPRASSPLADDSERGAGALGVLNWNVYIGTDVGPAVAALASPDPDDDLPALIEAVTTLGDTDFETRAEAIADEIAAARPAVVALQEVFVVEIDLRPLGISQQIDLDYLDVLQTALGSRGLDYPVGASVQNFDVDLPLPLGAFVRVTDHDMILVDPSQVTVESAVAQNFTNNLGPVGPVTFIRGFAAITGLIGRDRYTFVSTHLEPDLGGPSLAALRAAQAAELLAAIGPDSRAIVMGDFNDVPGSPMFDVIVGAGFADVWAELRPRVDGFTCCHAGDLSNTLSTFDERIDYVFARGVGHPVSGLKGRIDRLGEVPADQLDGPRYPIWPSDHAGLAAILRAPPAAHAAGAR